MKTSTKAVLLSAFLFPGSGHIYLKKYIPGFVLMGVSLAGLYYLITKSVELALQIAERIQTGEVPLDTVAITDLLSQQSAGAESHLINVATLVILACWVTGIIDSYRVGRTQDRKTPD